ncbi:T9SS type A sorting domain-containing protein [Panacibacter ginsenosidivorans]|uniref:T9SS type A sorting domain-containing protein n=1 Tax=Panacibacter ginsenosidivorans TaxID=1813871 RepID=A0A5B8V780_9BACT|nr:YCF48-related protein [Panacibacter ginsenosidivorans]QEC67327.1 T9SS type A sorting domain-containing protein [Panacibacter ginsenosidivorans]
MKANLLMTMLCACAVSVCSAQWVQQTTPTQNNLKAISFYNNRIGFAVGDGGTVLRTKNGGQTWQQMTAPSKDNLTSVTLLDSGIVIVTTATWESSPLVYRSEDAGATWLKSVSDTRNFYAAKTPAQRLFSVSDHIYESDDAGKQWAPQHDLNNTSTYTYIGFADENTGMVAGNVSGAFTYSAEFVRSADGGKNWYNSFVYNFPNANGFSTMDFVNTDTVFMFTNFYNRYSPGDSCQLIMLYHFRLRPGISNLEWYFKTKTLVPGFRDRLNACKFFANGTAYTVGDNGIIYNSSNYGKSWKPEYTGKSILHGIYMISESTGYVVGDGGLIMKRDSVVKNTPIRQMLPVKLYPNPAHDKATVSFNLEKQSKISVQVTDASGNIVTTRPAIILEKGTQQIILPVASLQRGIYQVNLISEGVVVGNSRLIIVR